MLNHYSGPHGERHKIFGSFFVFVFLCLPYYYHFTMFIIIICTIQQSMNYWHCASNWVVEQHHCRSPCPSGVVCICSSAMCGLLLESKHFLVCTLQILYMPPPAHYSGGDMMMKIPVLC